MGSKCQSRSNTHDEQKHELKTSNSFNEHGLESKRSIMFSNRMLNDQSFMEHDYLE